MGSYFPFDKCLVSEQKLFCPGASPELYNELCNRLIFLLNNKLIPHFRPIAFYEPGRTYQTSLWVDIPDPVLGFTTAQVADRGSRFIAFGDIYAPPPGVYGFCTSSNKIGKTEWGRPFGVSNPDLEVGQLNILAGNDDDYRFMFAELDDDGMDWVYSDHYFVPARDGEEFVYEYQGVNLKRADNAYGRQYMHGYRIDSHRFTQAYTVQKTAQKFGFILKRGIGYPGKKASISSITQPYRRSFIYCDTCYDLKDLFRVFPYDGSKPYIQLEYQTPYVNEPQLQKIINGIP